MDNIRVMSEMPPDIHEGLENGKLKQVGGVILDCAKREALAFLREAYETVGEDLVKDLTAGVALSATNAATFNLAISTMGFAVVIRRLGVIEGNVRRIQNLLRATDYKIDVTFYSNLRAGIDLAG